jgi:hypothetical protein
MTRTYCCQACGATWVSYPEGEAIERAGLCLRCDGVLVLSEPPAEEADASPPMPNGLEDDTET